MVEMKDSILNKNKGKQKCNERLPWRSFTKFPLHCQRHQTGVYSVVLDVSIE